MSEENGNTMTHTVSSLDDLMKLCIEYARLETVVEQLTSELNDAKDTFNRFKMDVVPEAMFELGLMELTLRSGERILITPNVDATIKAEDKPAAHSWMHDQGFGGLIKTQVDVDFDREQSEEAYALYEQLRGKYPNAFLAEKVHPQTLKAFVREQLEAGNEIPDCITVHSYNVAKIERK